jgi:agmatine deiminase
MREVQPKLGRRRVVLEGGGIEVNGSGRILTTEEWLLSDVQQRNPGFTREDYERVFAQYLGASETIWLNRGIAGDDTHGHIDDLARFVDADTVVIALERDRSEENYEPLQENLQRLKRLPLKVVPLPMPEPIQFGGQRLPASYANFYIANGLVLVPVFNDKNDRLALNTLAKLFPDREIVGIYSGDLVLGLGTLHCLTQQQIA